MVVPLAWAGGAGPILSLIASGRARSRAELIGRSGYSRATIAQRLGLLFKAGLIEEASETAPSSGGRPARILKLDTRLGVVLVADVNETSLRVAVTDLEPVILADMTVAIDLRCGPVTILAGIVEHFTALLSHIGRHAGEVLGIGLSLPAPVDYAAGRVVGPSIMTGWDDFDIRGWLTTRIDVPVLIENDVNLMTLSELRRFWPDVGQLLFIKAGTGIGSGIITDGRLYRGAQGAAGDIGHIQLNGANLPRCRCGKLGCVEAHAAGWALARDLRAEGFEAQNARDVVALAKANHPQAIEQVRQAGRVLGEVAADLVSVLNPSVIVVGGTLAEIEEPLFSGIRELVYQRSLPLATRELRIVRARSGPEAGLLGAARLVVDDRMHPDHVERTITVHARNPARSSPGG